jgi:hypothetical protein
VIDIIQLAWNIELGGNPLEIGLFLESASYSIFALQYIALDGTHEITVP